MTVEWDWVLKSVPVVATVLTAVVSASKGPGALRSRLKHDVELIEKVPESDARTALLDLVQSEIHALRRWEVDARRDWTSFVFALICAPSFGFLTIWLVQQDDWWSWLSVLTGTLSLVLLYGIFESAQRVPRDKKGRRTET